MSITIRQARPEDAAAIYAMIYELAVYEKRTGRGDHHAGRDPRNPLWPQTVKPKR